MRLRTTLAVIDALLLAAFMVACDDSGEATAGDATDASDTADTAGATDAADTDEADTGARDTARADTAQEDTRAGDASAATLCEHVSLGANASLGGRPLFAGSYWTTPVVDAPVDPNSDAIITSIGADTGLHADFGCCWNDGHFGIPYVVTDGTQPAVDVTFDYVDESDPGPYRIPADPPIEGGPDASGDRHVLVVDCQREQLHELFAARPQPDGSWQAGSGVVWDLNAEPVRPPYCTSADAAGLPVLAGLVRYDEIEAGAIGHALRFTVSHSRAAFVRPPASHWASSSDDADLPPMGMRVRLKPDAELSAAGLDVTTLSEPMQIIVEAMQTYGMIVADNGSDWYVSGAPDPRWDDDTLAAEFAQLEGRHFEVIEMANVVDDYSLDPGSCQLP